MQKFINAKLYTKDFCYKNATFSIDENGKFYDVNIKEATFDDLTDDKIIDLKGQKVIPFLIDIHTHGAMNFDFSDFGLYDSYDKINEDILVKTKTLFDYYYSYGIYPIATTLTLPYNQIENVVKKNDKFFGIYLEGPFVSKEKKGAQNEKYIKKPDIDFFKKLLDESCGKIKVITVAPEIDGAMDFIKYASKYCKVSVGHTNCNYKIAKEAFDNGASGLTHMFNAMNGINHREPGPIMAALENKNVMVELIADGYHISPVMIRFAFNSFGKDRIIPISDSLRCTGMPEGVYDLGSLDFINDNKVARLMDGTIAGSVTNLYCCMMNLISFGIKEEDAIKACTYNPASYIGVLSEYGTIENEKKASFIVLDEELKIIKIYFEGKKLCYME